MSQRKQNLMHFSTPVKAKKNIVVSSPSASSISSATSYPDTVSSTQTVTNDYTINKTTKIWQVYKPKYSDSLYAKIVDAITDLDLKQIAANLINNYKEENKSFLKDISQLLLDVADYQHYDIAEYKNVQEVKDVKQVLDNTPPEHDEDKYVAQCATKTAKIILLKVLNFYENILKISVDEELFYKSKIIIDFFIFLSHLAESESVPLRHTATAIGIKLYTELIFILDETNEAKKRNLIESNMSLLWDIFDENCVLDYGNVGTMKIQCLQECGLWIEVKPDIYFEKCLKYIQTSLRDESSVVQASLEILKRLMSLRQLNEYFQSCIIELMRTVVSRCLNNSVNEISKIAAELCCLTFELYRYKFTKTTQNFLKNMIFDEYTPAAVEGCKFYINNLMQIYDNNEAVVVNKMINLIKTQLDYLPLLVEAALVNFPLLQSFNSMFNMLEDETFSCRKDIFMVLIMQCALQLINGISPVIRIKPAKVTLDLEERKSIYLMVLQKLPRILVIYGTKLMCMKAIKEFLLILNEDFMESSEARLQMEEVLKILIKMYTETTIIQLLEIISEVIFVYINLDDTKYDEDVKYFVKEIILSFNRLCENFIISDNVAFDKTFDNTCTKLALLIKKQDITKSIHWESLFDKILYISNNTSNNLIKNLLLCCSWYLLWKLRDFVKNDPEEINNDQLEALRKQYHEFIKASLNILSKINGNFKQILVCDCIFELVINCNLAIDALININPIMITLFQFDENERNIIEETIIKIVFQNNYKNSLQENGRILVKYLKTTRSSSSLAKMFMYFNQDFDAYNDIFMAYYKNLTNEIDKEVLTTGAWINYYETRIMNVDSSKIKKNSLSFLHLIKQFLAHLPKSSLKNVLEIIINYARTYSKYDILNFFHIAANNLTSQDSQYLINIIEQNLPSDLEVAESLNNFMKYIKNKNSKKN